MTLLDAITWMQQRPGFCAVLGGDLVVGLSSSGFIMRRDKADKTYWRPNAMQCLAITWEVYTVEQLEAAAAEAQAAAAAEHGGANNGG